MITKVVLGVALVLIEFSIITLSQHTSLSSSNDTYTTHKLSTSSPTVVIRTIDEPTSTVAAVETADSSVADESTSTTKFSSTFKATTIQSTEITTIETPTAAAPKTDPPDFQLPENCAAYKVSLRNVYLRNILFTPRY